MTKGQTLPVCRNSALHPATPFRRRNPQLLQLMTQPVNPQQPKPPPHGVPPQGRENPAVTPPRHTGSTWGAQSQAPRSSSASSRQPSPPPRRPSFALPRPQCDEQSSENRTPLRQKGTAVCLQPLIPIQIAFPASLPQGRLGANCVCMGKAGVYFRK